MNLTDIRAQLRAPFNEHRLIFVIPKENLDTFVYHTELEDIRQFICVLDPSIRMRKSLMNKTEREQWVPKKSSPTSKNKNTKEIPPIWDGRIDYVL